MSFFEFGFDDNSAHGKKVSSFFDDMKETKKREKRQGPGLEDDGEDEDMTIPRFRWRFQRKPRAPTPHFIDWQGDRNDHGSYI